MSAGLRSCVLRLCAVPSVTPNPHDAQWFYCSESSIPVNRPGAVCGSSGETTPGRKSTNWQAPEQSLRKEIKP